MRDDDVDGVDRADGVGQRPEDEPGTGVVAAFGRQLKLLRVRAGLDREAQLRQALDGEIRRKTDRINAEASKTTRKKASAKTKRP